MDKDFKEVLVIINMDKVIIIYYFINNFKDHYILVDTLDFIEFMVVKDLNFYLKNFDLS